MAIGIEDRVTISRPDWPAKAAVAPGNLSSYAPIGLGLAAPMIMEPWDQFDDVVKRGSFYAANPRTGDPFLDAPVNDSSGGVVYFKYEIDASARATLLRILDVQDDAKTYAVFASESGDPPRDRYLAQIRIVAVGAMGLFGAEVEASDASLRQRLTIGELIGAFIDAQREKWGSIGSAALAATLNGDGDWAKEELAFGFMVENGSNGVYRLWSRPWLVTK